MTNDLYDIDAVINKEKEIEMVIHESLFVIDSLKNGNYFLNWYRFLDNLSASKGNNTDSFRYKLYSVIEEECSELVKARAKITMQDTEKYFSNSEYMTDEEWESLSEV